MSKFQKIWNSKIKELAGIKDNQGVPIDKDILETVAAMNLNGFPTVVSCAGHTESHPLTYPFVLGWALEKPKNRYTNDEMIRIKLAHGWSSDQIELNPEASSEYYKYVSEHHLQETKEFKQWIKKNRKLQKEITLLLQQFYSNRKVPQYAKIYLAKPRILYLLMTGRKKTKDDLRNNTIKPDKIEKIKREIIAGQNEMKLFTEFLKNKIKK